MNSFFFKNSPFVSEITLKLEGIKQQWLFRASQLEIHVHFNWYYFK